MSAQEDHSFIAEALPAFISEAGEQLEMLEQLLLQLEDEPDSQDLLGALFRCAHTVKGSAGIFGLDEVVAFTHHVETLLDRLRDGAVTLTPAMGTLLLQCNDQIRFLIGLAQTQAQADDVAAATRAVLEARLQAFSGDTEHASAPAVGPAATAPSEGPAAQVRPWNVNVAFLADTFRNGMDPLAVLNYVRGLGAMPRIACDTSAVPGLDTLDPESCHLGFDFDLVTASAQDAIESAFSFVRDDCTLNITPPAVAEPTAPAVPGLPEVAAAPAAVPKAAPAKAREGGATPVDDQRFIRVQADRLDAVINLLGELVIAGAGASLLARASRQGFADRSQRTDQQPDRRNPQWHAAAAHGAHRRNLLALPSRGARHGGRAGQGRGAGDRGRRNRAGQIGGRAHRRPADAPGAQRAGSRA